MSVRLSRSRWGVVPGAVALGLVAWGGVVLVAPSAEALPVVIDVTAAPYSAAGDGTTSDQAALQQALDDAAAAPGSTVVLPAAHTFLTGNLVVGSDTTLQIDGILEQSQNTADYSYTPTLGHTYPSGISGDLSMFHNLPLIYSTASQNVTVEGTGTIQLTRGASEATTIHAVPIGFYQVSGFAISDLAIRGANAYSVALYSSDDGVVSGNHILPAEQANGAADHLDANTDGISIMNAQHLRVTDNVIVSGDDGLYVDASYQDPRSQNGWWSSDVPRPSYDIEIDNNDVTATHWKAFSFIAWGRDAPDQRQVQISDIYVHDNVLAGADAVGCWCSARYYFPTAAPGQSPITRVRILDNEYDGAVDATFAGAKVTDLQTDFGGRGPAAVQNGGFEDLGTAWWSSTGDAGSTDTAGDAVLHSTAARTALGTLDGNGWVGYVQPQGGATASLYQGLGLSTTTAGAPTGFATGSYRLSTDVVTGGASARLFVHDTCTGTDVAETTVTASQVSHETLDFELAADCDDVQVGIDQDSSQGDGWALIDNVSVKNTNVIDDPDPLITKTGTWQTYTNAGTWGGTDIVAKTTGATATIPFDGTRVALVAGIDYNLGKAGIYLDGVLMTTADLYSSTQHFGQVIFDSGTIAPGPHTLRVVMVGSKNPASAGTLIDIDAVFVAD